jgi:hypothetical protein
MNLHFTQEFSMPKAVQLPSDRSFGYTFVVVFGLLAIWQGWAGRIRAVH